VEVVVASGCDEGTCQVGHDVFEGLTSGVVGEERRDVRGLVPGVQEFGDQRLGVLVGEGQSYGEPGARLVLPTGGEGEGAVVECGDAAGDGQAEAGAPRRPVCGRRRAD
jgi:hypothetical protein